MKLNAAYVYYHDRVATLVAESMLTSGMLTRREQANLRANMYKMWVRGMTQGCQNRLASIKK